jgi:hypothetical protein
MKRFPGSTVMLLIASREGTTMHSGRRVDLGCVRLGRLASHFEKSIVREVGSLLPGFPAVLMLFASLQISHIIRRNEMAELIDCCWLH